MNKAKAKASLKTHRIELQSMVRVILHVINTIYIGRPHQQGHRMHHPLQNKLAMQDCIY